MKFWLTCGGCSEEFPFEHPSVSTYAHLARLIVSCPNCNANLKTPEPTNKINMIPLIFDEDLMLSAEPRKIRHLRIAQ